MITIRPADKGGALVVMDSADYRNECQRQLNDINIYKSLPCNPIRGISNKLKIMLEMAEENEWISEKTKDFLTQKFPQTPHLYLLPKIHKSLLNPPGRPIVAATNSILQPLGIYIDTILQPIIQKHHTYIKDTTHFLNRLANIQLEEHDLLVTIDVNSLYTSIPHCLGKQAVDWLLLQEEEIGACKEWIMMLLDFIAQNAYFQYDKQYYSQISGTAMGATMAPAYANSFMLKFEEDHIIKHPVWHQYIKHWGRYIDDIFLVWSGPHATLDSFLGYINLIDERIQFTYEIGHPSVHFLDVLVIPNAPSFNTEVYHKPTDRNNLLHRMSFHPTATIRSLPYSQLLRIKRITNIDSKYTQEKEELFRKFKARGFKEDELNLAVEKADMQERTHLLETKVSNSKENPLVFVSKYSVQSSKIKKSILKHWPMLTCDAKIQNLFQERPVFANQRSSNLRDLLVNTKPKITKQVLSKKQGTFPCMSCNNCNNITKGDSVTHPRTGQIIKIKDHSTCLSEGVIYCIKCPCGLLYIGQTSRKARVRWNEHKSNVRTNNQHSPIARHFNQAKHQIAQMRFQILEVVQLKNINTSATKRLEQREAYWIERLDTVSPRGLNEELNLYCFL
ncbi:uncharacterized protein [Ambystoma mexicanum]|uniref:uncharacterized protein n=1 Tax=Ambystoma mexicanum TaxID=8296 RepID=UPI0037E901DB